MSVKDNSYGLAPLQDKMLDILKHFIMVCEENGLRYCACGGTCIGALRHQGFIPWDVDLDVFMPRPDYEKLWNICGQEKQNKRYNLCRTTSEKNYHHRVMQMVDLETTFINRRSENEDIEHGVYIDIIPLDMCAKTISRRLFQIINSLLFSVYNIQCTPEFHGNKMQRIATSILLSLVKNQNRRTKIWQKCERRMIQEEWNENQDIIELTTDLKSLFRPYHHEWFTFEGRKTKFEDIEINIPTKAEEYLTAGFGSYMEIPPVEKRRPQHNTVYIDLFNSYKKYKGKYYCTKI